MRDGFRQEIPDKSVRNFPTGIYHTQATDYIAASSIRAACNVPKRGKFLTVGGRPRNIFQRTFTKISQNAEFPMGDFAKV
jgi:hypothetical protein